MADLAVPTAVVCTTPPTSAEVAVGGGTVGLFAPVYKDTDGSYKPAECRSTLGKAQVAGLAILPGGVGNGLIVVRDGRFDVGAAVFVAGRTYYLSHNAGRIKPEADLASTDYSVPILVAVTTQIAKILIQFTGILIP